MNASAEQTIAARLPTGRRAWLLVGLVITLIHAPLLNKPFVDSDEAVYASIAALTNSVGRLYAEGGVDNKFPGIYWIYAGVFRIFGTYSMHAVHVVTIVVVLATSAVLGRMGSRFAAGPAGWLTALFYGIATTFYTPKMLAANTEIFAMLPICIAVFLTLRDRPGFFSLYVAGVLIGCATLVRQLAAPNLAVICAVPLFWMRTRWSRRLASSFVAALGFATVAGLLAYFFHRQGTLSDFWFWTISVVAQRYLPAGWREPPLHQLGMLAVTSVFWTLIALRARRWRELSFAERAVWGWLVISLAIVVFPGRFHPHYAIQVFAPLSVAAAMEFGQRLEEASEPRHWRLLQWSAGLLAALTVAFAAVAVFWEPFATPTHFSRTPALYLGVARYVKETTTTHDRIFVWGAYTPIYVMSDRIPVSRFVAFKRGCDRGLESPFADCWDSGPEMWPLLTRDLTANPPAVILDTAPSGLGDFAAYPIQSFQPLRELLTTQYSNERTIGGVVIYRRKPLGAPERLTVSSG
jgi:hypothetical protein